MPSGGSNKLLTAQECADYLSVPLRTLREHRTEWGLRAIRVGRELRFRVRDVEAWLDRQTEAA
jgi:excisionase family DNA binding protein